jgi:hypothetical protein
MRGVVLSPSAMKKIALVLYILVCSVLNAFTQFSLSMQGGLFRNKMDGGFEGSGVSAVYKSNLSAGISIDYSRGKVFGWMLGYNKFNKSILFEIDAPQGENQIGYNFVTHEIQCGYLIRLGKHINLSVGSYVHINTNQVRDVQGWETNFYSVFPEEQYRKFETGYQGKLQLQFYLTDRIYAGAFANAGMSLTDLRSENWDKAWSDLKDRNKELKNGPMKNLYQHFGLCIGFRTQRKED